MTRIEIENLIRAYNITDNSNGTFSARPSRKPTAAEIETLKAAKSEILAYFAEVKAEAAARAAKIAAIEGIKEIESVQAEWEEYHYKRNKAYDSECGRFPAMPKTKIEDVKAKYPRAAAYLMAQGYTYASNYAKAAAGRTALERIINGEDYETVIAEMKTEWTDAAHEAVMNS
jgi:hypothetical protein